MKLSILLCLCLLAQGVFPHMPTVYEFCSYVVANGEGGRATCDASQCQGRPGKIGPVGMRGIQGLKGQKGENGTSEGLEGKVRILEEIDLLKKKTEKMEKDAVENKEKTEDAFKQIDLLKKKNADIEMKFEKMEKDAEESKGKPEDVIKQSLNRIDAKITSTPMNDTVCYMGMKSGQIPDSAITSSSDRSRYFAAHHGRLDGRRAWIAGHTVGQWIQVDLGQPEVVAGVVTQGGLGGSYRVTSYKVSCGNVASSMTTITEHGQDKVFSANTDGDTKVVNKFPQLMTCRYIRIYPQTYHINMMLRVEIIRGICMDIY